MLQFRIRSLLLAVFAFAVFFAIARTAGYVVAAGTMAAVSTFAWAVFWRRRGTFVFIRVGVAGMALAVLWFLAVDFSRFVADCPDCHCARDVFQYRVFCISVSTQIRERPTMIQRMLADLGVPCEHEKCNPRQRCRYWGLAIPAFPCFGGIYRLSGDSDYSDAYAENLRRLGADDPKLAAQLHDRIKKHDYQGFWWVIRNTTPQPTGNTQ